MVKVHRVQTGNSPQTLSLHHFPPQSTHPHPHPHRWWQVLEGATTALQKALPGSCQHHFCSRCCGFPARHLQHISLTTIQPERAAAAGGMQPPEPPTATPVPGRGMVNTERGSRAGAQPAPRRPAAIPKRGERALRLRATLIAQPGKVPGPWHGVESPGHA